MSELALRLTVYDGVARLTFDQPNSRANVLSTALWTEFGRMLDGLVHRPDVKGLLLESAKPGIFIAGADLKELARCGPGQSGTDTLVHRTRTSRAGYLEALPYPTAA